MIKIKYGNLIKDAINGEVDVVVHGCNCFNTMRIGFAKAICEVAPEARQADNKTVKGDHSKLGGITYAQSKTHPFVVVNAYTQFNYGHRENYLDLTALESSLIKVRDLFGDKRIGLPKIGAGYAGGNWDDVQKVIIQVFGEQHDVTIYFYED